MPRTAIPLCVGLMLDTAYNSWIRFDCFADSTFRCRRNGVHVIDQSGNPHGSQRPLPRGRGLRSVRRPAALELAGWRWHRFWVVFGITTVAGVLGLNAGQAAGGQVLVLGILLAFAGGVMALEVAKLLAFTGGGIGSLARRADRAAAGSRNVGRLPQRRPLRRSSYRLWTMLVTSMIGVLIAVHATLILGAESGLSVTKWVADNSAALNGVVLFFTVIGASCRRLWPGNRRRKKRRKRNPKRRNRPGGSSRPNAARRRAAGSPGFRRRSLSFHTRSTPHAPIHLLSRRRDGRRKRSP